MEFGLKGKAMYSELYGDFKKLLTLGVMGRQIEVPEKNTLLRGFQYASPETVSYGRFCWNGTCKNCTVTIRKGEEETKGQACVTDACEDMQVVRVSKELVNRLKTIVTTTA